VSVTFRKPKTAHFPLFSRGGAVSVGLFYDFTPIFLTNHPQLGIITQSASNPRDKGVLADTWKSQVREFGGLTPCQYRGMIRSSPIVEGFLVRRTKGMNMDMMGHDTNGTMAEPIDEDILDSTAQEPISIPPDLAAKYIEVARFVASVPEKDAIAMFVPAEDDPRLDELRRFLSFISKGWNANTPFYFFPKMREEIRNIHLHHNEDGTFPDVLFGRPTSYRSPIGYNLRPKMFFCDYTSCGQGKHGGFPSLRRQMGKLLLLNALGWDVYGCPNPILFRCRIQRAIPWIVNLVAESDEATLEEQEESVRKMAGAVGAVVFSGRRSLHQYFRLAAPIRNPHVVTPEQLDDFMPPESQTGGRTWTRWHLVMTLKRTKRLLPMPVDSFRYAADLLRGLILERSGIQLCPSTLFNFSCLARVPGFVHTGSGERARLLSVNQNAVWHTNSLSEPDDVRYSPYWRQELGIPVEEVFPPKHRKCSVSPPSLHNLECQDSEGIPPADEGTLTLPMSHLPPSVQKGSLPAIPTHNIRATRPEPKRSFLDDFDEFASLRTKGIPQRGHRRSLHRVIVNIAQLRGWVTFGNETDKRGVNPPIDVTRVKAEWRRILSLAPQNIGCSIEEGVAEIEGFVHVWQQSAGKYFKHHLPECTKLPDIDRQMKKRLRDHLAGLVDETFLGGTILPESKRRSVVTGMTNIASKVLWPLLRECPRQCIQGRLNLSAKKMKALCPRRQFGPVRDCMYRLGIIRQTKRACHAAGLTRTYFVNIPLIIWLMGFRKTDLVWERHVPPRAAEDSGLCLIPDDKGI